MSVDEVAHRRLTLYLDLLHRWGRRVNLTADPRPEAVVSRHLPDGFALAAVVQRILGDTEGQRPKALDVGSGGGLPAVVFGVLCPRWCLTLCEPRQKRAAFLRTVVAELGLEWVVVGQRVEQVDGDTHDLCLSRATWSPAVWLERSAPFCVRGGWTALFLASCSDAVPRDSRFRRPENLDYQVGGDVERRLLLYRRR